MKMVALTLKRPSGNLTKITKETLQDLLWVHARAGDKLEHIYVRAGPEKIDLVFFLALTNSTTASIAANGIFRRALSSSPALCGWHADFAGL
ncbi:hypothetical protein [Herbidospora cretacea]|uniref:hypothetical protein n=1 Tax=Herbidospora cretacea TaxID=28444 RepID=UPI0012DEBD4B|nr:hypothetical protein [Herbidospora cretacea]